MLFAPCRKGTHEVWYPEFRLGVGNHGREKSELEARYVAFGTKMLEAINGLTSEQKALRGAGMAKFTAETFLVLWIMKFCYSLAHLSEPVLGPLRAEFSAITKDAYDLVFPAAGRKKEQGFLLTTLMLATIVVASTDMTEYIKKKTANIKTMTAPSRIAGAPSHDMINVGVTLIEFAAGLVTAQYMSENEGHGLCFTAAAKLDSQLKINTGTRLASSVQAKVGAAATQVEGYGKKEGIVGLLYFCNSISVGESDDQQNIECCSVPGVEVPMWDISKIRVAKALNTVKVVKVTMNSINALTNNVDRTLQLRWKYNYEIRNMRMLLQLERGRSEEEKKKRKRE
jgi:hypothetical protein